MPRRTIPDKLQAWVDARKKFHLSHAQVQMAHELGMNPKKLGGKANHRQEPWKMPLPDYIEHLYEKHFGKPRPDRVLSIEESCKQISKREPSERNGSAGERQRRLEIEPDNWRIRRCWAVNRVLNRNHA